jgi:hypothetical protein
MPQIRILSQILLEFNRKKGKMIILGENYQNDFISVAKHNSGFVAETVLQIATTRICTKYRNYAYLKHLLHIYKYV